MLLRTAGVVLLGKTGVMLLGDTGVMLLRKSKPQGREGEYQCGCRERILRAAMELYKPRRCGTADAGHVGESSDGRRLQGGAEAGRENGKGKVRSSCQQLYVPIQYACWHCTAHACSVHTSPLCLVAHYASSCQQSLVGEACLWGRRADTCLTGTPKGATEILPRL
jgi:hypothetical protein